MAAPSINGVAMPVDYAHSYMGDKEGYKFHPQQWKENGAGVAILYGPQIVTWRWAVLTQTALDWWMVILGGQPSVPLLSAELWDHTWTERTFTEGTLYRPEIKERAGGKYFDVELTIKHLIPLL